MLNPSMNNQHHQQADDAESEVFLDLTQLKQIIIKFWHIIALSIVLTMLVAFILALIIPKKWEASVTLQIGRTPIINAGTNQIDTSKLIEDPDQTLERIKLREFREQVLTAMGLPVAEDLNKRSDIVINTLKGSPLKGTDFINLSVRGYSKDDARNALNDVVQEVEKEHALIMAPIKVRAIDALADTNQKLSIANASLQKINTSMNSPQAQSSFAPSIVAIDLLGQRQAEVNFLELKAQQQQSLLKALSEYSTKMINRTYVTKDPVFPKKSSFLILGAIFGAFIGIGLALMRSKK